MNYALIFASILERDDGKLTLEEAQANFNIFVKYTYEPRDKEAQEVGRIIRSHAMHHDALLTLEGLRYLLPQGCEDFYEAILKAPVFKGGEFEKILGRVITSEESTNLVVWVQENLGSLDRSDPAAYTKFLTSVGSKARESASKLLSSTAVGAEEGAKLVIESYIRAKEGKFDAVYSGYSLLDRYSGGIRPGELVFVAAPPGTGKSTFALNWAYNAAVYGGFNVIFYSFEMSVEQVWRAIFTIHANEGRAGDKITNDAIKNGVLPPEDEQELINVVMEDFKCTPDYGAFQVVPLSSPAGGGSINSVIDIEASLLTFDSQLEGGVDLVVVDYPALLPPPSSRANTVGDPRNGNIRDLKQLALRWKNSKGLAILCPHQINRQGHARRAGKGKQFGTDSIADMNEVERSADQIYWLYRDMEDSGGDSSRVELGCMKNRDGSKMPLHELAVDFSTRRFKDIVYAEDLEKAGGLMGLEESISDYIKLKN